MGGRVAGGRGRAADLAQKLGLSLAALTLLLLAVELGVRVAVGPVNRVNFTAVPASIRMEPPIPGAPYLLRPNSYAVQAFGSDPRGYFDDGATLRYRTNSLGFRGPETTRSKPLGSFRILGFGDSFTFGTGVRQPDTYLAVLERELNRERGAPHYEVLNLGVPGWSTASEVNLLRYEGLGLSPDLVVIGFFLDDAGQGENRAFRTTPDRELPAWRRHLWLVDHLAARLERRRGVARLAESYRRNYAPDALGWRRSLESLRQARALADENGFGLALIIFPVHWDLSGDYAFREVHATIRREVERLGIDVLDLLPVFAGFDGPELWVHPSNQHPNERAHALVGRALRRFLAERGLVAASVPGSTAAIQGTERGVRNGALERLD